MSSALEDSMEIYMETISEEEMDSGASGNKIVKSIIEIGLKLYDSRMLK